MSFWLTNQKLLFDSTANQVVFLQYHIKKEIGGAGNKEFFIVWLLGTG